MKFPAEYDLIQIALSSQFSLKFLAVTWTKSWIAKKWLTKFMAQQNNSTHFQGGNVRQNLLLAAMTNIFQNESHLPWKWALAMSTRIFLKRSESEKRTKYLFYQLTVARANRDLCLGLGGTLSKCNPACTDRIMQKNQHTSRTHQLQ